MSQIEYETRLVTVPVITAPRRRSLPNRLGPWPIKRSKSEAEIDTPMSLSLFHDPFENGRPNLAAVLAKVDEECATIEEISQRDNPDGGIIWQRNEIPIKDPNDRLQRLRYLTMEERRASTLLIFILVGCAITVVTSTPMMTFVFAKKAWGKIALEKEAPSVRVFGVLLALPSVSIGLVLTVAIATSLATRYGWKLLGLDKVIRMLVLGVLIGVSLHIWTGIWLLPLLSHN